MPNTYFSFKQFTIHQDACAMKVTTDAALFGAWCGAEIERYHPANKKLLDIGAGTGLLSLMVAQKAEVSIHAVEIEADAALQAERNVRESPYADRIAVASENITSFSGYGYDLIISNPPFYQGELKGPDAVKNAAHHGTTLTWQTLFSEIDRRLLNDGYFFLLLPYKRATEVSLLLERNSLFAHNIVLVKQTSAHTPFRMMVKGAHTPTETATSEITIRDEANTYTGEFTRLLQPYYLYL